MNNTCICCGEIIPEGRQVCPTCEKKQIEEMAKVLCDDCVKSSPCTHTMCDAVLQNAEALYNVGYRKQSEWISVKDRLPEKNTRALCYFKFEPKSPDVIGEDIYNGGGRWMCGTDYITHWMPLPEPPKKGGAE